jgi:UDP-glucose:(heptosyl)LPS alpha-1,3-glucosyltransferase
MERVCAELVRRAADRYRFVLISADVDPELREIVEWRRISMPRRPASALYLTYYARAALTLNREEADLRHAVGALVPNRFDLATVHHCHAGYLQRTGRKTPPDAPPTRKANTWLHRTISIAAERWTYGNRRAGVLAAVSEGVARELRVAYPGVDVRITPNGVDSQRFKPDARVRSRTRAALGIPSTSFVALFVGGDWAHKGVDPAIRGIAAMSEDLDPRLLVVGDGDRGRFAGLAASLGAAERVRFVGSVKNPVEYFAAADVFVFPTMYEAAPLVVLEAAASGLPIVAPPVNGVEEFVVDHVAGVPVEPTAESVGAALVRLAATPRERAVLGGRARRLACRYSWEASAAATCEIYDELLDVKGWQW